ncbi:DNA-BINDING PROTEIN [Salix koriyanagi]|uniref:DNA-BINDING PROTEIN n=1 Tax=Salix koriyanagi TaxID=2511006 RepID=A0A9Q0X243_9ROSI|nr:DNA-BINDING PROTEIN [Salix koriyanagi]
MIWILLRVVKNKGFWMSKGTDGDPAFENPSRLESKRSHQWFIDDTEPELFPNKKQAVQTPNSTTASGIPSAISPSWHNTSGFQSVPNQFIHRLFGAETARSVNFTERNLYPAGTVDSNASETSLNYGGIRKVKINQVKDFDSGVHAPKGHGFTIEGDSNNSTGQAFHRESQSSFISTGQIFDKEDNSVTMMGHNYNGEDVHVGPTNPTTSKLMIVPIRIYDHSYDQSSVQTREAVGEKELRSTTAKAAASNTQATKSKSEPVSKNRPELKTARKEAPNSFPSNVRSLISTGMLDGVPVKYVSLSREELRGIIKGSGYLCGCQSCDYSKVLNAYEFERHADCKTKHPNNHIYFENGKTIYQIVQELRSTPESMLFDVIQTVFGAPINQKSFRIWKESFQAATRELQRIYGKEELNR